MKIISWNLRNIGINKLARPFTARFQAYGLGNNVIDYMMKLVMGDPVWNNINDGKPADIFVVIELKCGGQKKGEYPPGAPSPTLATIVTAMNNYAIGAGITPSYNYLAVPPLIIGRHEAVGIIYNTVKLTYNNSAVLRDINAKLINPRTPFYAQFTSVGGNTPLHVIGLHAPPPKGGVNLKYRPPILFANKLATVPQLINPETMIMGDFNCAPNSVYNAGMGNVGWNIPNYATSIPNGTLTSVRNRLSNIQQPPANYLSGPYDNLLRNFDNASIRQAVLDTIGNARNVGVNPIGATRLSMVLSNFNKVSDHLPISMYTV